jgi:pimeloyl-ACP methyl ester carboxylesterase
MTMPSFTLVLIHGLWMTPRSWDRFREHYEARGLRVIAPPWPRMCGEVEAIRRDPSALAGLGVAEIVDHYADLIRRLDVPPVLVGHSFGGLVVQLLLDRGLGTAGVAIDPAAPRGVWRLPFAALKAASPVLVNPLNYWRTVPLSFAQFRYAFANTMTEVAARNAYECEAIPGPGRPLFQAATANLNPFAATRVNFHNDHRAPLLLIAGGEDHTVPASVVRSTFGKYARSSAVTAFKEFPGRSHLLIAQDGWEEVADYALTWVTRQTDDDMHVAQASTKIHFSGGS